MLVLSELSEGSSSSSTSSIDCHRYDVFLSFRGLDTRNSFTAYLHKALMDANITTFLDDEDIETGEDLKPELESAIKASRASVIVLSKNYATSTWCLDELVLILEQRMISNHIVFPIFYHVESTYVRKQQSSFGDAMAKHRQKMEAETNLNKRIKWAQKIDRWNKALIEVAGLKGKDVNGRLEPEFIEEIVKDVYRRLHVPLRSHLPLLIGMESSIKFVLSWLKDASSHKANILTIWGMGGIGKTSLAKYVYGLHCPEFNSSSYIGDISRRCDEKFNGLLHLQKQLYDDISKTRSNHVHDISIYTSMIENMVACKEVFLVLDDINSVNQLDALLGSKVFHPKSKIIVTTKDTWLTESCALFKTNVKPKHAKHELKGLSMIESQKLLCFHAFVSNYPTAGYEDVSGKFVMYCEGHPLALEVLGKSLHNRDVAYWEDWIEQLKKETGSPINNVLRTSFESLTSNNDKELFKHIACFFVGFDRDVAETILNACDISTRSGITNLIHRCLLSIGWNNELTMHQLLQRMGRFIIHEESPDKPWKRSRLWCHVESFKVLKQKKGKGNLLGLTLDMRMLKKEKLHASFELKTDTLSNMDNLMLLQLNYVKLKGSYENFPVELRWLCMHGFPLKSIPLDLPMENLVALDMSYSNIESFDICYSNPQQIQSRQNLIGWCSKHKKLLGSLKILDLSFCEQLRSISGFDEFSALEMLIVRNCTNLLEVCDSIKQCFELVLVDLRYCIKLEKLPRIIGMINKVETLLLDGCYLGKSQFDSKDMGSTKMVNDNDFGINIITSSSTTLEVVPSDSKLFTISLPRTLLRLSLVNNNLSTTSFPMDFCCLSLLRELYLDDNPIVSMPNCVRSLPRLETLGMSNCKMLTSVENPPYTLREFILYYDCKPLLRKVTFDPEMSPLELSIGWKMLAPSSFEIEGVIKIQPMAGVEEKVLRSLGWSDLDFLSKRRLGTSFVSRGREESEIQMYYEFGIFSTIYGHGEMPKWITYRSMGPSISFTIPSSPKNLTGLNFCLVQLPLDVEFVHLPKIIISNITKNHTWIYEHFIGNANVDGGCLTLLSHWMFVMNEMEAGDHVTITLPVSINFAYPVTKECGVSFVYDDGDTHEEEDALGYYKSWNHIISRDLIGFQLTNGKYLLYISRFLALDHEVPPWHYLDGEYAHFKDKQVSFRAFSERMFGILEDGSGEQLKDFLSTSMEYLKLMGTEYVSLKLVISTSCQPLKYVLLKQL
ncbi:hypothetical protein Lser_V15G03804 [Lactuca serriola]